MVATYTYDTALIKAEWKKGKSYRTIAKELGCSRDTVRRHVLMDLPLETPVPYNDQELINREPIIDGTLFGHMPKSMNFPDEGRIATYILSSCQNNTHIHEGLFNNLKSYANFLGAKILISRFTYKKEVYGKKSVKPGYEPTAEDSEDLWYDERILGYCDDKEDIYLAPSLLWHARANTLPTESQPLNRYRNWTNAKTSCIIPHPRVAMESVAVSEGMNPKFLYTTGCVSLKNYIAKKTGILAERHHSYGALIVEVDCKGNWWARQIIANENGEFQDLNYVVKEGRVRTDCVFNIVWGDIHAIELSSEIIDVCWLDENSILETLCPFDQYFHDFYSMQSQNHHEVFSLKRYEKFLGQKWNIEEELDKSFEILSKIADSSTLTYIVRSNHDEALEKWLNTTNIQTNISNMSLYYKAYAAYIAHMESGNPKPFNTLEWAYNNLNAHKDLNQTIKFLSSADSVLTCGIEHAWHGHRGPHGRRGQVGDFRRIGAQATIGHFHTAGIYDGLYVVGCLGDPDYAEGTGPRAWSKSLVVLYSTGQRAIITLTKNCYGKWDWRGRDGL